MTKNKNNKAACPADPYGRTEMAPVIQRVTRRMQTHSTRELKGFERKGSEVCPLDASGSSFQLVRTVPINPGVTVYSMDPNGEDFTPFPQARPTANSYEQYRFKKLVFKYIPQVGTIYDGSVVLAWDRDPLDPTPTSFARLTREGSSVSTAVYRSCELHLPPSNWLYTREAFEPAGSDLKTYDFGRLHVAFTGADSGIQGRLVVDYELDFRFPTVNELAEPSNPNGNLGIRSRNVSVSSSNAGFAAVTGNVPLGDIVESLNGLDIFDNGGSTGFGSGGFRLPGNIPFKYAFEFLLSSFGANGNILLEPSVDGFPIAGGVFQQTIQPAATNSLPKQVLVEGVCPASNTTGEPVEFSVRAPGATTWAMMAPQLILTALQSGGAVHNEL